MPDGMSHRWGIEMRILVAMTLAAGATSAGAGPAEYAFRWDPTQGGPGSAAAVVVALKLQPGKSKKYVVRYFDVVQPTTVPPGYKVIGRERGAPGEKPDATYKVRGPEPIPSELLAWKCPLTGVSESKAEVDVGFVGVSLPKRAFSVSCTVDKAALQPVLPAGYSATAKGCSSQMERTKARSSKVELKVEQWSLPKGEVAIEVSMEGSDSDADLERFRAEVVNPLLSKKAVPLKGSKSELGSEC